LGVRTMQTGQGIHFINFRKLQNPNIFRSREKLPKNHALPFVIGTISNSFSPFLQFFLLHRI
jgi:hypothetical protein